MWPRQNRDFMKYFKFLFLAVAVFVFFGTARADNTFIFSTDPQSIAVGQMSDKINVQSSSPVTETTYLDFTSSSPTGEFLTSAGNPLQSAYISTGDSNRAVYYEDSTAGDFVITAVVLSEAKVPIATISQNISVGIGTSNSSGGDDENATTTDISTTTDATGAQTVGSGGSSSDDLNVSAHSSPAPLSSAEPETDFEISAGRDRLTSVGNSLVFRVAPIATENAPENDITYVWSFGDGTTAQGSSVSHAYQFSGDYVVVCNAQYSDEQAVSRATVKVIDPKISLARISGGLQIGNNSGAEINLENWKLVSENKSFTFPQDTLLPNGRQVIFADEVTGINSGNVSVQNPLGQKYAEISDDTAVATQNVIAQTNPAATTDQITAEVQNIKEKVVALKSQMEETKNPNPNPNLEATVEIKTPENSPPTNTAGAQTNQTAAAVTVFEAPKTRGLIGTILAWPIAGFDFIRNLFVEH